MPPALRRLAGAAWISLLALSLAGLLWLTPLYPRLEAWLGDSQQRLSAAERYFTDTLVVEIDEASIEALREFFGTWPYQRDVYALLLDYLAEKGARGVVFDVLFSEGRNGDARFRTAIANAGIAVLAASALNKPAQLDTRRRLAPFAARGEAPLPALDWAGVALPNAQLLDGLPASQQVGMISVVNDSDGVLRAVPLLHRVGDAYLPSLVLASLFPGQQLPLPRHGNGTLSIGPYTWPVGRDGTVRLYFPSNPNAVPVMPLARLASAALGVPGQDIAPAVLRGKTVFIGNTALFSDHVNTPRGIMNGVHVLAIAHELLAQSQVLTPPRVAWDLLLLAVALLPAALRAWRPTRPFAWCVAAGLSAALLVYLGNLALLRWFDQQSWLAFPLVANFAATLAICALALREEARQRAQAAIARADAETELALRQQRFIAMVSHEFRTPLAIIEASLQNLKLLATDLPHNIVARHGKIHRASHRLQALINNHLTEDRLRSANQPPKEEPFDIFELASRTARRAEWPELICATDELRAMVRGDKELMRIVLANLIDNAMKYSPDGGLIRVEGRIDADIAEVRVIDSGIGISAEALPHIFEQYFRADNTKQSGAGLGLYLVKEIVERHGGTIDATSQPGRGTTLCLRLPIQTE
ncbi:MAG: CHASE2 domain-containing protein [Sulfuricella sp.]|nr:CHASE2 domain-containing protein [Sulfuricella sp.]